MWNWIAAISALVLAGCAAAPVTTDYARHQNLAREVVHTELSAGGLDAMTAVVVEVGHAPMQANLEQAMRREMTVSEHEYFTTAFRQALTDVFP
jgi:hypothetical protein